LRFYRWADGVEVAELSRLAPPLARVRSRSCLALDGSCSNAPTQAVNLLTGKAKPLGHGFRNVANYHLRLLSHCGVT
jgi:Transposase